jgi:co-chaperonin GroES (HSP10)
MTLRPIGPRVFIRPDAIPEPEPSAIIIPDTDFRETEKPTSGVIVALGKTLCRECRSQVEGELAIGQHVAFQPGAVYHEFDWQGELLWSLPFDAIIGVVSEDHAA